MSKNLMIKMLRLGEIEYSKALRLQEHLVKLNKKNLEAGATCQNILLLLQHKPVYTTGIRTKEYSEDEELRLRSLGADFVRTNRGGLITFHGPGQLVAYPILNLNQFVPETNRRKSALGMKWYVNALEEVVIQTCSEFGLRGTRSPHTGVWLGDNKVCAMGVHSSQLLTSHGLALNCNVNLDWFKNIVPCGIVGKGVTSLSAQLKRNLTVQDAEPILVQHFAAQFSAEVAECSTSDLRAILPRDLDIDAYIL